MFKKLILSSAVVSAGALMAGQAHAKPPSLYADKVRANPDSGATNTTLSVSGPNGFRAQAFSKSGGPTVTISENGKIADGIYKWEMNSMSSTRILNPKRMLDNGRGKDGQKKYVNKPVAENGGFRVVKGVISQDDPTTVEDK